MKKLLLLILSMSLFIGCGDKKEGKEPIVGTVQADGSATYDVEFDVDYNNCGTDPLVSVGGVDFGNESLVRAGRVASKNGYINISKIEADIDLSALAQRSDFTGDWLNAAFYAVSSKVQPIKADYCDAEYGAVPFCQ